MLTAEQIMAAQKANVEAMFEFTSKAFGGVEKLMELNLQVVRTTMNEMAETTKAALAIKDPKELLALQTSLLQPTTEKAAAYARHVFDITSSTKEELRRVTEANTAEAQRKFMAVVDNAARNAPAGTENAVALVKSAVAATNNAYDSINKAARQAAGVAEANLQAMTSTAVRATQSAVDMQAQANNKAKRPV
jgi:phasin family protein